ncbi:MAG: hypothetical protein H6977_02660 [Gammaproteobacteria bacterium]|nr:hypothetical protein [Gammaproteobacteria bacterium]
MELKQNTRNGLHTLGAILALALAFQLVVATTPAIPAGKLAATEDARASVVV